MAMSMRSRGTAAAINRSRSGIRPVYEDFKPMSEWKHEDGADILLYKLPGFVKEQIRIIAESRGVLRVRGERLISGNKWSRFQEEVVVPKDCSMQEIRAKFEGGILQITMPKKISDTQQKYTPEEQTTTIPKPPTTSVRKPDLQPKPRQSQEKFPSSPNLRNLSEHKPKNLHEELLPKETSSSVPKSLNDLVGAQETFSPLMPFDDSKQLRTEDNKIHKETFDYNDHKPNHMKDRETQKETRGTVQYKEDEHKRISTYAMKDEEAKERNRGVFPNMRDKKYVLADTHEKEKLTHKFNDYKGVTKSHLSKSRAGLDEDRQLLVNMGVAVLVIVALGSYISYSIGSARQANE